MYLVSCLHSRYNLLGEEEKRLEDRSQCLLTASQAFNANEHARGAPANKEPRSPRADLSNPQLSVTWTSTRARQRPGKDNTTDQTRGARQEPSVTQLMANPNLEIRITEAHRPQTNKNPHQGERQEGADTTTRQSKRSNAPKQ